MAKNQKNIDAGREVKRLRQDLGLTRMQLAERLHLTQKTISQVENGWQALSEKATKQLLQMHKSKTGYQDLEAGHGSLEAREQDQREPTDIINEIAEILSREKTHDAVASMTAAGISKKEAWAVILRTLIK